MFLFFILSAEESNCNRENLEPDWKVNGHSIQQLALHCDTLFNTLPLFFECFFSLSRLS